MTSKKLGETTSGDIFYFEGQPEIVFMREVDAGPYQFRAFGDEVWSTIEEISSGMSDPVVIVVHNTYTAGRTE